MPSDPTAPLLESPQVHGEPHRRAHITASLTLAEGCCREEPGSWAGLGALFLFLEVSGVRMWPQQGDLVHGSRSHQHPGVVGAWGTPALHTCVLFEYLTSELLSA